MKSSWLCWVWNDDPFIFITLCSVFLIPQIGSYTFYLYHKFDGKLKTW